MGDLNATKQVKNHSYVIDQGRSTELLQINSAYIANGEYITHISLDKT
jgi:hypothetical protein